MSGLVAAPEFFFKKLRILRRDPTIQISCFESRYVRIPMAAADLPSPDAPTGCPDNVPIAAPSTKLFQKISGVILEGLVLHLSTNVRICPD